MRLSRQILGATIAAILVLVVPADADAQAKVYDLAELTAKPSIASPMAAQQAIQKSYPGNLQRDGVQGKVVLQFVVKADGKVDPASVQVQSSDESRLDAAAREAIVGIQFVPGEVAGSPVATNVVFPISYVAR